MKRVGFAVGVTALLLSACTSNGGSSLPPSVSSALRDGALRWRLPAGDAKSSGKLYISDPVANKVDVYQVTGKNQKPVGSFTKGIDSPAGITVDSSGKLYVANTMSNTVTEYEPGKSSPVTTYSADLIGPVDVAVDSKGTVYVANFYTFINSIVEFPAGKNSPSLTIHNPAGSYPVALTINAKNDLYVTYQTQTLIPEVYVYALGATKGTERVLSFGSSSSSGLQAFVAGLLFDKSANLLAAVGSLPGVEVFPPGKKDPSKTFGKTGSPQYLQFASSESDVFVADTEKNAVEEYTYPGGQLVNTIASGLKSVYGVAVGP
jgi:hypothetical protein